MDKTNPPADKCYFCGEWYEEVALGIKAVKDQGGGYVPKPICRKCEREIEERGKGE